MSALVRDPLTLAEAARIMREPWLDKRGLADHLSCSVRSVELFVAAGMPHAFLVGRTKFRASEAEAWLEAHGHLEHRGDRVDTLPTTNEQRSAA